MKFNYKNRGFVVITLSAMLVVVGVANYQLSKKSALGVSEEFKAYEQAQLSKNSESNEKEEDDQEVNIVDSKSSESDVEEKVTETSKEIEEQLTSEANMQKSSYILDMKMTREKQRNDLAEELNCHESTISRGVNGKYMLTPFGTYEFKYFFNSSIETDNNEAISSVSIKNMIRDKIKAEKKDKPLSDDKIAKLLKEQGINVARRTVAKYREELGILSSSKRKKC